MSIVDKRGKYTYTSIHGNSVNKYVIMSVELNAKCSGFTLSENIISPYMPLELGLNVNTDFIEDRTEEIEDVGSWIQMAIHYHFVFIN